MGRRDHPLAGRRISRAQLEALRHVDVQLAPGIPFGRWRWATRLGIDRDVALIVPSFSAAAAVVAATDFVATLPESLVDHLRESFGMCEFADSTPHVTVAMQLAWHERTDNDPLMRVFRELVVKAAGHARLRRSQIK